MKDKMQVKKGYNRLGVFKNDAGVNSIHRAWEDEGIAGVIARP